MSSVLARGVLWVLRLVLAALPTCRRQLAQVLLVLLVLIQLLHHGRLHVTLLGDHGGDEVLLQPLPPAAARRPGEQRGTFLVKNSYSNILRITLAEGAPGGLGPPCRQHPPGGAPH